MRSEEKYEQYKSVETETDYRKETNVGAGFRRGKGR